VIDRSPASLADLLTSPSLNGKVPLFADKTFERSYLVTVEEYLASSRLRDSFVSGGKAAVERAKGRRTREIESVLWKVRRRRGRGRGRRRTA
jgi:hypothetical protein